MKTLFLLEILLFLISLLYVVRVFWPVRMKLLNGDKEIIVSIRNRHNLKICTSVIVIVLINWMVF